MDNFFMAILNWSEVWAVLIPLFILSFRRKQPKYLQPVIIYLWIALVINLIGDTIADFKSHLPNWLQSNNVLYNIHSIIRFACFSLFFMFLDQRAFSLLKKVLPVVFIIFVAINFMVKDNFLNPAHLSGNLLAGEAYLLLIYCMTYYLSQLNEDKKGFSRGKDFWVVTGLSIYVVTNFFVFLFYVPMINDNPQLAANMWSIHNVSYILLCFTIARAFYVVA